MVDIVSREVAGLPCFARVIAIRPAVGLGDIRCDGYFDHGRTEVRWKRRLGAFRNNSLRVVGLGGIRLVGALECASVLIHGGGIEGGFVRIREVSWRKGIEKCANQKGRGIAR